MVYNTINKNITAKKGELMKVSAVICEYNPFHNGHKYQLEYMKGKSDAVVCIMSGDFVQRGEAAIFDKFERTRAALMNGADLVIMLPVCFSLNTAERFAFGGVSLADSLGVVDTLCFGSECGDIEVLKNAAKQLLYEPKEVSEKIRTLTGEGMSYPKAREKAFSGIIDEDILCEPNNILATEYIKALISINSKINPETIVRYKTGYHDKNPVGKFASASAIREMISNNDDYKLYVPDNTFGLYENIYDTKLLSNILVYLIRTKSAQQISKINDVTEGLENRIKSAVFEKNDFFEIAEFIKTKRYTLTKIKRILLSLILGIEKNDAKNPPEYIRVLGMNKKGADLLSRIKKKSDLPIITKTADFKGFNKSFETDILAADIYSLCCGKNQMGKDYKTSPIIAKF